MTVTLGQVTTAASDNAAWSLRIVPSGVTDGGLTKGRDEELADGLKFRIVYSKKLEKVRGIGTTVVAVAFGQYLGICA